MGSTLSSRQQKFRQGMKDAGKRQRSFFLTEEAMETLQQYKESIQVPSLNHALEHLLTSVAFSPVTADQTNQQQEPAPQDEDKQTERLNEIAAQAQITSEAFRNFQRTYLSEQSQAWASESTKLALLIDPRPVAQRPLPESRNVKAK